jgi:3'-phosphoadenosine 5'-phosphosulfate sulfotransferase (PAPS reductase)/FAD synthetase
MQNKHTLNDFKRLQSLPWGNKVLVAQTRIMEWYYRNGGRVFISFSGGKDSTVLLHLVREQFPDVPAVFVNTGLEYPEVVAHVKATPNTTIIRPKISCRAGIEKYGYPVVSKDVALTVAGYRRGAQWAYERMEGRERDGTKHHFRESLYGRWRFLLDAPFLMSDACCEHIKENPLHRYAKAGELVPYVGLLATESRRRRDGWLRSGCNSFDGKHPRSAPLSFWSEQDILRYIYEYKLPIASVYGEVVKDARLPDGQGDAYKTTALKRTGCMFCLFGCHLEKQPNRIQQMAKTHPKLYEYCLRDFEAGGLGLRKVMDYVGIPYKPIEEDENGTIPNKDGEA